MIERVYNVPLRKEFQKAPPYKRAKKAISALKEFLRKHMKSDEIKLGNYLNEAIWARGIKRPPHHVKINVIKDDNGLVVAELVGKPMPVEKEKKQAKTKVEEMKEKLIGKPKAETKKPKKEETVEKPKKVEKKPEKDKPVETKKPEVKKEKVETKQATLVKEETVEKPKKVEKKPEVKEEKPVKKETK